METIHAVSRREALVTGLAVAAGACAGGPALARTSSRTTGRHAGLRQEIPINDGWRFIRKDVPGAQQGDFDDSGWQQVTLPHTYNGVDGEKHGHYYRGPAWYRLNLQVPAASGQEQKNYFIYFEGAATVAEVFVNGHHIGTHRGGFAGFCMDATAAVQPGGKNVLAVRVDNAWNQAIAPLSGDFNIFGGLYRTAHLLVLNPVCITPLDHGGPGAYVMQEKVSHDQAHLKLTALLRNGTAHSADVTVDWALLDHAGRRVGHGSHRTRVKAHGEAASVSGITLHHPHLWNGRHDPYLYTMRVRVRQGRQWVDQLTQPVGVRYFHVEPENGFFLNGKAYPLRGVCTHDDRPGVGRAATRADYVQDVSMIHAVGANSVRMAHYQHDQAMYEACDRLGLVVWTEDGLVNHIEEDATFNQVTRQQFIELVKQTYNHPSVVVWSLYNELGFRTPPQSQLHLKFPATRVLGTEFRFKPQPSTRIKLAWEILYTLNQIAHDLDPSRLTTAATDQGPTHPINFITDVICFNRYYGWYGGHPGDWPGALDQTRRLVHERMPGRCIGISEYGAGANAQQHEYPVKQPKAGSQWHPEEWQCVVHEAAYKAIKSRHWLWNSTLWVMFDFSSAGRNEGGHPGRNDKGLVTYDRKLKKDAYFFYLAQWTTEPFVYICERRFTPRPAGTVALKAYSNCAEVELFVNGKSQGVRKPDDHVFVWPDVELKEGGTNISAVGTDADGKKHHDRYTVTVKPA